VKADLLSFACLIAAITVTACLFFAADDALRPGKSPVSTPNITLKNEKDAK
jgi:hypothetical protein